MNSRPPPGDDGDDAPADEHLAFDDDVDEVTRTVAGQTSGGDAGHADSPSTRVCSGRSARDAATMLHRALGLPEPAAVTAHWGARQIRSVDYRVGAPPVVH